MATKLGGTLALAFLVSACGGSSDGDGVSSGGLQSSLNDRTFLSESIEGWTLVPGSEVRISFRNGELSGHAGCNSLSGDYSLQGDTLVMRGFGMTEMGCDAPRHDQDD